MSLHAHPDDEVLLTGGWLAQRAEAGDRVVLVFATDGAAGLTGSELGPAGLGAVRRREAEASARHLGATRVVWLGYADSGMAGRPSGAPRSLAGADPHEVARAVAQVLDEEQAAILTGYDARGGYGHPDHLAVHRAARAAQGLARARPVLLEATLDRTWLVRVLRVVRPVARLLPGLTLPGEAIYSTGEEIDLVLDVRPQLATKLAALAAHASQGTGGLRTARLVLLLPRPLAARVVGRESFTVVR